MSKPIERKVTQGQVEFWLGSDNTLREAIEALTELANNNYSTEELLADILDTYSEDLEDKAND